jgi:RNA polymerase sigma-70 factor (ECF subfamily)
MPESSPHADAFLVQLAQAGETEAFGTLYEQYAALVFRFLYAQLPDRFDAEDLTADVFMRAWRSLPRYRERGYPFSAYLFRIARNVLIDHQRRAGRVETLSEDYAEMLISEEGTPDERLLARLERQALQRTLSGLREDYRTVLVLRFISELSPEETAQAMGRSPGSVRVLQHRALQALRKSMDQQGDRK